MPTPTSTATAPTAVAGAAVAGAPAVRVCAGARLLTMCAGGIDEHDSMAAVDGRIAAIGGQAELRRRFPDAEVVDLEGRLVTPGLIDCHTHIVYGGDRSAEMERRLAGESYESIARAGGGILSTAAATARLGETELAAAGLPRLDAPVAGGGTTL